MINKQLIQPETILVVGGSENVQKPGGKILKNIIDGNFRGNVLVINPKADTVQGVKSCRNIHDVPAGKIDLAILIIPAKYCTDTIEILARQKNVKAFIIISAGFSEQNEEGAAIEAEIVQIVNDTGGCLLGPNCIGILNKHYHGVFTAPIPKLRPDGCDLISGSGATAVFILESGIPKGLAFSGIYSVGNAAQIGIEDVLKYMDENFNPCVSPCVKLLYIEDIRNPDMLLHHTSSLIRKGCRIAAIKAGVSDAGNRAASSHTGAIADSDQAVDALFRKAGIVRCFGREELVTVASVFMHKKLKGKNIAIITHAGGPAVMLTDALSEGGMKIPEIRGKENTELLKKLYDGASVSNPIDLLATGTAKQLETVINFCENRFDMIDAMVVIFGSPGLINVFDAYEILHKKMTTCKKPIFPILPSTVTAKREVDLFLAKEHVIFPDEVVLGKALTKVYNTPEPASESIKKEYIDKVNTVKIRQIIDETSNGYIPPRQARQLLQAANIPRVNEGIAHTKDEVLKLASEFGYPLALKALGPVHKTDVDGVVLNIKSSERLISEFFRVMEIKNTQGVIVQPMLSGIELFIGAKYENRFGHVIICGLGGIFVEILKDVSSGLVPLTMQEALSMIASLKSHKVFSGYRGNKGVNEQLFASIIVQLSVLLRHTVEIKEMDLNPLIATPDSINVVDARIKVEK